MILVNCVRKETKLYENKQENTNIKEKSQSLTNEFGRQPLYLNVSKLTFSELLKNTRDCRFSYTGHKIHNVKQFIPRQQTEKEKVGLLRCKTTSAAYCRIKIKTLSLKNFNRLPYFVYGIVLLIKHV